MPCKPFAYVRLLQTQHWSVFLHLIPMPNYRVLTVEGAVEFFLLLLFFLLLS